MNNMCNEDYTFALKMTTVLYSIIINNLKSFGISCDFFVGLDSINGDKFCYKISVFKINDFEIRKNNDYDLCFYVYFDTQTFQFSNQVEPKNLLEKILYLMLCELQNERNNI